MTGDVTFRLSEDDSIVLFELLHRLQEANAVQISNAERESVDAIIGSFERELVPPFQADYLSRIEKILADREARAASESVK